ncbi:uncharacterized protein LOC117583361 isoform X1 [Drosophila guanche]|uniref:Uncharacterized protein n=1 Tax=Drosophila guanche TaxID=7266 RepID=A0A3B0JF94_DROGU|nr:uncharacterized protein LOC117583361 isoform X1 [Drosophila guanche]SPP80997.1 Hypothetical predicted protein [Drosophila guanche]
MNIHVLLSLLFFLTPGGCPMYTIDVSTLEVPNDFQNELTLQSMLSSELNQARNDLNTNHEMPQMQRSVPDAPPDSHKATTSPPGSLLLPKVSRSPDNKEELFLGTNLFGSSTRKCFSAEDIALIAARRDFETLLPKSFPNSLLCDSVVQMLMKYFYTVNRTVKDMAKDEAKLVLQRAFYDALGGYLRYYLAPVAQVSFYAGRLKLCTVERLVALYQQCRIVLNTNGNGWRTPVGDIISQLKSVRISPVKLPARKQGEDDASSCALLEQITGCKEAPNNQMIVPLPRLEPVDGQGYLTNIYLPLKQRRIYNLRSPHSAFVLVKFFQTVTQCYRFQGMCQKAYNRKLRNWIRESVQLHYNDEVFYPGLGGILQVYELLQNEYKGKARQPEGECQEEQCFMDYQETTDDVTDTGSVAAAAGGGQGRKQSRSPNAQREWETHSKQDVEECRECDDDASSAYVACVALFLALLLLLLLLIIYCCMRKGRKPNGPQKIPRKRDLEMSPPTKTKASPPIKAKIATDATPAMPRRMAFRGSYYSSPIEISHSEKAPQSQGNDFRRFLDDSHTSTSSLACQFNRKCMPLKFPRSSPEEKYYTRKRRPSKIKLAQPFHPLPTNDIEDEASLSPSPRNIPLAPSDRGVAVDPGRSRMPTLDSYRSTTEVTTGTELAMARDRLTEQEKQKIHRRCEEELKEIKRCEALREIKRYGKEDPKELKTAEAKKKSKDPPPEKPNRKDKHLEKDTVQDEPRKSRKKSDPKAETKSSEPEQKRLTGGGCASPKDSPGWETTIEDSS